MLLFCRGSPLLRNKPVVLDQPMGHPRLLVLHVIVCACLQVMVFVFVIGPRFFIASLLLYSGSLYLANTGNLGDLILNAVALTFVKDVDELIFEAIVQEETQRFIASLRPLRWSYSHVAFRFGRSQKCCGLPKFDFGEPLRLALVCAIASAVFYTERATFWKSVKKAEKTLCQTDRDFLHQPHPDHGMRDRF